MSDLGLFRRLPSELRVLIWELSLASDEFVTFRCDQLQQQYYHQACQPPVTRISRQIRAEALPIYYQTSNFILHTAQGPKADDALRWLQCNEQYLPLVRKFSFWIRQVPQGAVAVSISRRYRGERWSVDEDWKWITVLRRPASAEINAKRILEMLSKREMLSEVSEDAVTPASFLVLMAELRALPMDGGAT